MMLTIFKYPLSVTGNDLFLPEGSRLLTVQTQYGIPTLWALVDSEQPSDRRYTVEIYGTGEPILKNPGKHIATFQENDGYVWHAFFKEYP